MPSSVFMAVMLGIIVVCAVLSIPALLLKKCPQCGVRNGLDATACKRCQAPFPQEPQP